MVEGVVGGVRAGGHLGAGTNLEHTGVSVPSWLSYGAQH